MLLATWYFEYLRRQLWPQNLLEKPQKVAEFLPEQILKGRRNTCW